MKCTNENFRNVVCLLRYWPRGDVRGMMAWTTTRKRICGDEESKGNRSGRKWFGIIMTETDYRERYMARRAPTNRTQLASRFPLRDSVQEKAEFAILFRLKRLFGTKRFRKYVWYDLKRLFGTKLCGHPQSS